VRELREKLHRSDEHQLSQGIIDPTKVVRTALQDAASIAGLPKRPMREWPVTRARAEEYRRRAQECLDLARKISLERDRAIVLDMAQSWLRLAEQQERQEEIIQPL
jgi:hypothetical protein